MVSHIVCSSELSTLEIFVNEFESKGFQPINMAAGIGIIPDRPNTPAMCVSMNKK